MSVLEARRTLSPLQFVSTYNNIYREYNALLQSIPKRKKLFIVSNTYFHLNESLLCITNLSNHLPNNTSTQVMLFWQNFHQLMELMQKIQDDLFWINLVKPQKEKRMLQLEELLKKEIALLVGVARKMDEEYTVNLSRIYIPSKVKDVIFLEKLQELTKLTIGHVSHLPQVYQYSLKFPLIEYAGAAFKCAYDANNILLCDEDSLRQRAVLFDKSLDYLESYEQKLFILFSATNDYCNAMDINHWSYLLSETVKLIKAIKKSDRQRIKK